MCNPDTCFQGETRQQRVIISTQWFIFTSPWQRSSRRLHDAALSCLQGHLGAAFRYPITVAAICALRIILISQYWNIEMSNFAEGIWRRLATMTDSGCQGNVILSLHFSHDFCKSSEPPRGLSPPPSLSLLRLRGAPSHRVPWQRRLMARPRFPDSWHLPGASPWRAGVVGSAANKQMIKRLEMFQRRMKVTMCWN